MAPRRWRPRALAKSDDPRQGGFELAEILASLDRSEEAHQELERLRASGAPPVEIDRRLALLAFNSGDYKEARQRFTDLLAAGEGNDGVQLYLADIAARDGDPDAALAGYRRLYDSSVALTARARAAGILLQRHSRTEALALLDDYAADHPEDELDLTLVKAHLLADHGEGDTGLAVLSSALERHPQHPSIEYDRAVILEQAGHVHESVKALQQILEKRPDDPTMLNALGYTLADHSLELPHAESLIRRALTVMPDNPAALDSLGWVRFRSGDLTGASSTLARAYSLGHDGEIAAHWGEVLWVSGKQGEARRVWAAALGARPGLQAAQGHHQAPAAGCEVAPGEPAPQASSRCWRWPAAAPSRSPPRPRHPGSHAGRSCRGWRTSSSRAAWPWLPVPTASTPICAGRRMPTARTWCWKVRSGSAACR